MYVTLVILSSLTGSLVEHFKNHLAGHKDSVSSLAFSTDGQLLASGSFDGLIQVWDISSGNLKCTLEGPGSGIEVSLSRVRLIKKKLEND